jgi:hypothetical protein
MKRYRWSAYQLRSDLDVAAVNAARLALARGKSDVYETSYRESALASLQRRRAKLAREIEMIDATIASMQPSVN